MGENTSQAGRPVWLLDVDGVVNALTRACLDSTWPNYREVKVRAFRICYSPTVIDFINDMSSLVDVYWLTTWNEDARLWLAPEVGLNDFPVVPGANSEEGDVTGRNWWKLLAAQETWRDMNPSKLLWTDDDIPMEPSASSWGESDPGLLLLPPKPRTGLSPENLRDIQEFFT